MQALRLQVGGRPLWLWIVGGVLVAGLLLAYRQGNSDAAGAGAQPRVSEERASMGSPLFDAPADGSFSASLSGTEMPDGLLVDAQGHLISGRGVRDVFDYCLSAVSDLGLQGVDGRCQEAIRQKLSEPARGEALQLWQRYLKLQSAMVNPVFLSQKSGMSLSSADDLDKVEAELNRRMALRRELLGPLANQWFGDEEAQDRFTLGRYRIQANAGLSDEEKRRQVALLEQSLPPEIRAARQEAIAPARVQGELDQLRAQGASPAALGAALAREAGAEAGARLQQMEEDELRWKQRYQNYAAERHQLEVANGTLEERQLQALRSRHFPTPAEMARATALDSMKP